MFLNYITFNNIDKSLTSIKHFDAIPNKVFHFEDFGTILF
jgi:hypothetical protein